MWVEDHPSAPATGLVPTRGIYVKYVEHVVAMVEGDDATAVAELHDIIEATPDINAESAGGWDTSPNSHGSDARNACSLGGIFGIH